MWKESLRTIALKTVPLTEEMINNGKKGNNDEENLTVKPGDILIPSQDMTVTKDNQKIDVFSQGEQYKVLTIRDYSESAHPWVIMKANNDRVWGISFDEELGGGAKYFKKILPENDSNSYDKLLKDPRSSMYINAILLVLWRNRGQQQKTKLVPLHREKLEDRVRQLLFSTPTDTTEIPSQQEFSRLKGQLSYYSSILGRMQLVTEAEEFYFLTEQGINYCSEKFQRS